MKEILKSPWFKWQNLEIRTEENPYKCLEPILPSTDRFKCEYKGKEAMMLKYNVRRSELRKVTNYPVIPQGISTLDRSKIRRGIDSWLKLNACPYIAKLYDFFENKDSLYLITDYSPSVSLHNYISANIASPFNLKETINIINSVAQGLHYIHQKGIILRGLNPKRLIPLLDLTGKRVDSVLICSFELARAVSFSDASSFVQPSIIQNTEADEYMAPELLKNAHEAGEEADIYSLGAILYEIMAKKPKPVLESGKPIKKLDSSGIDPKCKPAFAVLEEIALKCLDQKEPEKRMKIKDIIARIAEIEKKI